jgi:hypothetical protein
MKIVIGNKTQQTNYFDVAYTFTLDIPISQQGKADQATTKNITGVASYKDETQIQDIQNDLISRYNKAQEDLNVETKLSFYGISWDGTKWI